VNSCELILLTETQPGRKQTIRSLQTKSESSELSKTCIPVLSLASKQTSKKRMCTVSFEQTTRSLSLSKAYVLSSIAKVYSRAKEYLELHEHVESSTALLDNLELFLSTFQRDLSAVSGHISDLQARSRTIDGRLQGRKVNLLSIGCSCDKKMTIRRSLQGTREQLESFPSRYRHFAFTYSYHTRDRSGG
jgi:hypothetical protein